VTPFRVTVRVLEREWFKGGTSPSGVEGDLDADRLGSAMSRIWYEGLSSMRLLLSGDLLSDEASSRLRREAYESRLDLGLGLRWR